MPNAARVVVLLNGGQYLCAPFRTVADAQGHIKEWADRQAQRIRQGKANDLETCLVTFDAPGGGLAGAYLEKWVIGMYLARNDPTPAERMAAAVEKATNEGEEWRGS